jgi:hypothetical protein
MRRSVFLFAGALALVLGSGGRPLSAQAVASVCKDGATSTASGRGACSGHGGVDAAKTAAAKAASAPAQVTCADGTMSPGGRGACSHHGGIRPATAVTAPAPVAPVPNVIPARPVPPAAATRTTAATRPSTHRGEDNDPTDAIAQCKDGMYSHAANHRGACSKHGGVSKFLKP